MKARRMWLWILLPIAGLVGLIVLGIVGLMFYGFFEVRKFERLTDTRDLRERTRKIADDCLARRPNGALVIGLVQQGKAFTAGFGRVSSTNASTPDATTIFEIGSITKVFTGIALARMVHDGKLRLEDTIEKSLPPDVELPVALRPITLVQLATHTAGFPRLPDNLDLSDANAANPYSHYTSKELYEYLRVAKLSHPPGRKSDYSNLGAGVLGHILELRAGKSYEQLVHESICEPLGMSDTAITLSAAQQARLAPGHNSDGKVVPNWDFAVLAPAGGLRSCVHDLLKFVQANLATNHSTLGPALALAQQPHFKSWIEMVGLCWQMSDTPEGLRVHWHNGGTGGYVSFLGFDAKYQTGIAMLSSYGDESLDRMGMELLKLAARISWE